MHNIVGSWFSYPLAILLAVWTIFLFVPPEAVNLPEIPLTARSDDTIVMRAVKGVAGVNFAVSSYMLVGPPVVIETDLSERKTWMGTTGMAGLSWGPIIWIHDGLHETSRVRVLRHEYQHYCQFAVLTPLGLWGINAVEGAYLFIKHKGDFGKIYMDQWCEKDARKYQNDGLEFSYILFVDGNTLFVRPLFQLGPRFEPRLNVNID